MPPAKIITGPLDALEDALDDAVRGARERDGLAPVTVLTGNVLLRPYLRRRLATRGVAQLNVRFLRPNELAALMAGETAADRVRLSPGAERLLVREIAAGAGGYFAPVAGRDGFAEALHRLFREIDLGGFSATSLRAALGPLTGDETSKEAAIAALYDAYDARRRDFASIPATYAAAMQSRLEGPLFVYGLWSPSHLQRRLIEHAAFHTEVTVFLPNAGIGALDEAHAAFRDHLVGSGAAVEHLPPPAEDALASALFSTSTTPATAGPSVELVNAADTVREIWEAARTCLGWAADGIKFHEMAVVYRNREPYRALIDEIFAEAGIETYLHDGRLLSTHPLGRRVLALLRLAASADTFSRVDVMEFLTETELPSDTIKKYGRVSASEWETFTREAGVVGGIEQWQSRLERLANEKREGSRAEGYEWLANVADRLETLIAFAGDLHAALAARPEEATWTEHLAYLRSLAANYATGVEPILEALDDLRSLSAVRERAPFDVFCRAVRDDLESRDTSDVLKEPVRMFGRRGVAVIDATSIRHLRFRAVLLVGVAERAWPPPPRPDPLLLERERRRLNDAAADASLPLRTEPDQEALGFWLAAQSASEHLVASFARADAGRTGKHLPSYFFRALAEALEGRHHLTMDELDASPYVRRFEAGRLACTDITQSLSGAEYDRGLVRASYENGHRAAIDALSTAAPPFGRAIEARSRRRSPSLTPFDGVMSARDAVRSANDASPFTHSAPVSASRLETYATCPYRYFLRYVLRVDPVEEPEAVERIDHLQRGSLIHEILQVFLERIGRGDPPSKKRRAAHIALLMEVAHEAGDDRVAHGVTGRPLIWKMDKRQIDEDLVRWYDQEVAESSRTPLRPGAFEARFGPAYGFGEADTALSTDDPLALDVDGRTIKLQGRIDRIDWDDEREQFRVIDYKTGKYHARKEDVFRNGESLQLPIYLRAAAKMLDIPPEQGEAQYFHASSRGDFKRKTITGDELIAHSTEFEQILTTVADGVDTGFFAPNPGKNGEHCMWCDYKDVCDARITRIMTAKSGDARGDAYRALGEIP